LPSQTSSFIDRHLSNDIFHRLKERKTPSGFTLHQAIQSNVKNPDSTIGIYAGDKESYTTFSEIFNPVIADYHGVDLSNLHTSDFSNPGLPDLDPDKKNILSTRIRVARNMDLFPFTPHISLSHRKKVRDRIVKALETFDNDMKGRFFPMNSLSPEDTKYFHKKRISFVKGDRFQEAAGINRDWPEARGFFVSHRENFMVWVNEEDHLRIISLEKNGDISTCFNRLAKGVALIENRLTFAFSNHLGYLAACPSNLGTAMRASVHVKLPRLEKTPDRLRATAKRHNLQIRGTHGEKTAVEQGIFDISNRQRLGIGEVDCITTLHRGVSDLLKMENEQGQ